MTPAEKLLHERAMVIARRADELSDKILKWMPSIPPLARQGQALIMALLERDFAVREEIEESVRVTTLVDNDPSGVATSLDNMNALILQSKITSRFGRCDVRRKRKLDHLYGSVLLFGYSVTGGGVSVDVTMPGIEPSEWEHVRCYIDGNSYMWMFAPSSLRSWFDSEGDR